MDRFGARGCYISAPIEDCNLLLLLLFVLSFCSYPFSSFWVYPSHLFLVVQDWLFCPLSVGICTPSRTCKYRFGKLCTPVGGRSYKCFHECISLLPNHSIHLRLSCRLGRFRGLPVTRCVALFLFRLGLYRDQRFLFCPGFVLGRICLSLFLYLFPFCIL